MTGGVHVCYARRNIPIALMVIVLVAMSPEGNIPCSSYDWYLDLPLSLMRTDDLRIFPCSYFGVRTMVPHVWWIYQSLSHHPRQEPLFLSSESEHVPLSVVSFLLVDSTFLYTQPRYNALVPGQPQTCGHCPGGHQCLSV